MFLPNRVLTDQTVVLRQPQRTAQISQGRRNAPSLIRCRLDLARLIPGAVPWGDLPFHPVPHRFLRRRVKTILAPLPSLPTACAVVPRRVPLYHPEARRFLRQRVGTTLVRLPLLRTVYGAITWPLTSRCKSIVSISLYPLLVTTFWLHLTAMACSRLPICTPSLLAPMIWQPCVLHLCLSPKAQFHRIRRDLSKSKRLQPLVCSHTTITHCCLLILGFKPPRGVLSKRLGFLMIFPNPLAHPTIHRRQRRTPLTHL